MPRLETDPFGAFNFLVESGGVLQAGFQEISGIMSETESIEYREGNEAITARKLPGLNKFGNITLKRGIAIGQEILDWRKKVTDGDIDRQEISIIVMDELRQPQVRYNLTKAWPCKWTGPELKAGDSSVAVEQLDICCEGVSQG